MKMNKILNILKKECKDYIGYAEVVIHDKITWRFKIYSKGKGKILFIGPRFEANALLYAKKYKVTDGKIKGNKIKVIEIWI
jgi:hypothetical protein